MARQTSIVLSGTARASLGESFVHRYCACTDRSPLISLDLQHNPYVANHEGVQALEFNLNPLEHPKGYTGFSDHLQSVLSDAVIRFSCSAVDTLLLSAARYTSGPLADSTLQSRKDILGLNVCGKYELLHSILTLNRRQGFDNDTDLSFVDIGSTRGLYPSEGRTLYAPSKALGLELCVALHSGHEVGRCLHVAIGPIDTHMLHANHWHVKENGPKAFVTDLLNQPSLYHAVFVDCSVEAFEQACDLLAIHSHSLRNTFDRYVTRRCNLMESHEGILQPEDVADLLVKMVTDRQSYPSGLYVVTAQDQQFIVASHALTPRFKTCLPGR